MHHDWSEEHQAKAIAAEREERKVRDNLKDMGFSDLSAKRAIRAVNKGEGLMAGPLMYRAIVWLEQNPQENDDGDGVPAAGAAAGSEKVAQITAMGYTEEVARQALQATGEDVMRAMEWILSNPSALGAGAGAGPAPAAGAAAGSEQATLIEQIEELNREIQKLDERRGWVPLTPHEIENGKKLKLGQSGLVQIEGDKVFSPVEWSKRRQKAKERMDALMMSLSQESAHGEAASGGA